MMTDTGDHNVYDLFAMLIAEWALIEEVPIDEDKSFDFIDHFEEWMKNFLPQTYKTIAVEAIKYFKAEKERG